MAMVVDIASLGNLAVASKCVVSEGVLAACLRQNRGASGQT